jgi:hypothetical protein
LPTPTKTLRLARHHQSLLKRMLLLFVLLWLVQLLVGCNIVGWLAQAGRGEEKPIPVAAEYLDLRDQRVAVLVSADDQTLFRFPRSTFRVGEAVSRRIIENVPGTDVTLPRQVQEFQRRNPYWITAQPSRLIDQLGVDRLVVIDLSEYQTNEPGNVNVWRGIIDATVGVHEADGEDPDNRSFERQVRVEYPKDSEFGKISESATQDSIEAATLEAFSLRAGGLFYDHEVMP